MKKLIYKIEGYTYVDNPDTGETEKRLSPGEITVYDPTEEDLARAADIALGGEYTVVDDGKAGRASADEVLNMILGVTG